MSNFYISNTEKPPRLPSKALRPLADLRRSVQQWCIRAASALWNENLELPLPTLTQTVTKECFLKNSPSQRVKIKISFQLILEMAGLLSADEEHGHS